jgi:hypothetical protein
MKSMTTTAVAPSPLVQELEWYFTYAETALRLGRLTLLPGHEVTRLSWTTDDAVVRRALELATTVQLTLRGLKPHHVGVLRAGYTPRRWPIAVAREFRDLSAIVVRLVCAAYPWPERTGHDGLEQAAALHLARLLAIDAARPAHLRRKARVLRDSALSAYERARESLPSTAARPR